MICRQDRCMEYESLETTAPYLEGNLRDRYENSCQKNFGNWLGLIFSVEKLIEKLCNKLTMSFASLIESFFTSEQYLTHQRNMENYYKRKTTSTSTSDHVTKQATKEKPKQPIDVIDLNNLPWDPVDRPRISQYNVNQRDDMQRRKRSTCKC
ncbi:hypothetical protein Tco_0170147 [Tanacetum coccineum]